MAETVTIEGRSYLKRNPLGVIGLSVITLGIYFFYWYWKISDEISAFEHDESISPTRSLMAILIGWIIIVPPFIAIYNTAKHTQKAEQRLGVQPLLEPTLAIVFLIVVSVVNGLYFQEHLNRLWDRAAGVAPDRPDAGNPPAV